MTTDRRSFLQTVLSAGMMAATASDQAGGAPTVKASPEKIGDFELDELTIDELQDRMRSGRLSARSLIERYLARIDAIDRRGPRLNSVIEINPDARRIASVLDGERKATGARGPLHGVPVLIKDNIDTADRMATTAGSLALVGAARARDAFVVERLRGSGAVLLGKTNLGEWANFRCSYSTNGWSARGGRTRNPYALDRTPSGSSSGSAVAVTANLCAVAVGTETDGSIVSPSSINGIVGIKPTVGLVSRSGIIPISRTQDTAGPMARTVRDAAILLSVMAGRDPDDAATTAQDTEPRADYTHFLDDKGLQGARIGVARNYFGFHDAVDALMGEAITILQTGGATLVDPAELSSMDKITASEMTVLLHEFKAGLNEYLARLGPGAAVRSLADIIAFNERNRRRELRYFGQDVFLRAGASGPLGSREYLDALDECRRLSRTEGIDAVMDKHRLDALIAPTEGPAALTDFVVGDHQLGSSSAAAAVAGYPSITVPAGSVFGLPIGISFFGRAWSEPVLIKLAYAFEQASKRRRPPRFAATAALPA